MFQHNAPISCVCTFKEKYIATAGYDNIAILWNAQLNKGIFSGHHDHLSNQCQFSHDGNYLAESIY